MKRRVLSVLILTFALLVTWTIPAGAIAEGEKSDDARVGALFAVFEIPGVPVPLPLMGCSGSQVSHNVFLTAGHCLAIEPDPSVVGFPPGTRIVDWWVSFDMEAYDPSTGFPAGSVVTGGDAHWDPGFGHDRADLKDYGVVVFPDGSFSGPHVDLPYEGQLDDMKRDKELQGLVFDRVGYGVHPSFKQGPPMIDDDGYRYETTTPYKSLNQNWLRLHENYDKTGLGGGCFGDSGSPILHGNIAMAVTTGGDPICRSESFNQRLDTADAQAFLGRFLDLP